MKSHIHLALRQIGRIVSLMMLAGLGTIVLMRSAPGYFSDVRELDPQYANAARVQMEAQQSHQKGVLSLAVILFQGWTKGDFGQSKQFDVPVLELIKLRWSVTSKLLLSGVGSGWLIATLLAIPIGLRLGSKGESIVTVVTVLFLAIPVGALATACLLAECGGPVTVLATLIAVRDFKLLYKLVRRSRMAEHLNHARAQGIRRSRITLIYLLPPLSRELLALGVLSIITALSAIVPVEVIFDVPGLGQLAWSAAMNRDLPVLLSVTLIMAAAVGLMTATTKSRRSELSL